ncbi:MAG: SLC13/DASS family transporter [Planctomycetes bacterium]|nr:SLC13/DASS family transporter [Planctomycetota bacterium]
MSAIGDSQEVGGRLSGVGFWLGIGLFLSLLLLPPPASMRRVAEERFGAAIAREAAAIELRIASEPHGAGSVAARARDLAVDQSARTMMAAAATAVIVACWWVFVALPIPATSLLPIVLLPLLGVLPLPSVTRCYAESSIFLFLGGFVIALAMERWGLHRRIALHVLARVGLGRRTMVLGVLTSTALISMWISNTATAMMMLPIGLAIVAAVDQAGDAGTREREHFAACVMLAIAYGANIGGMGTPIGTPPNLVFRGLWHTLYPAAPEVGFLQWVFIWVPVVGVFVLLAWLVLTFVTCPIGPSSHKSLRATVRSELATLSPLRGPEAWVLAVFLLTAALWMTRSIPIGRTTDYGWAHLVERLMDTGSGALPRLRAESFSDAGIAIAMAILLFILPVRATDGAGRRRIMDWETAKRLPWGVLLLFGGGFAIAAAFEESGLSHWCAQSLHRLPIESPLLLVVATCLLVTFVSEVTSNTATAQIMLPIVAQLGEAAGVAPILMMLAATGAASFAFMLPVGTPPNAIVFASGRIRMRQMVGTGFILNLIGVALVSAAVFWLAAPSLGAVPPGRAG